jgi:hypothetical protein
MKKGVLIGVAVVVLLSVMGVAGYAFARTVTPLAPDFPFGWGGRGRHSGMMGGWRSDGGYSPMHEYMQDALAEALGISHDELEELFDQGKTMWQIAQDKGFTQEQFRELVVKARNEALEKMVEDGVITREQADWMKSRMDSMWDWMQQNGGGFGGCPGMDGFGGRGHWNNPPVESTPTSPAY